MYMDSRRNSCFVSPQNPVSSLRITSSGSLVHNIGSWQQLHPIFAMIFLRGLPDVHIISHFTIISSLGNPDHPPPHDCHTSISAQLALQRSISAPGTVALPSQPLLILQKKHSKKWEAACPRTSMMSIPSTTAAAHLSSVIRLSPVMVLLHQRTGEMIPRLRDKN